MLQSIHVTTSDRVSFLFCSFRLFVFGNIQFVFCIWYFSNFNIFPCQSMRWMSAVLFSFNISFDSILLAYVLGSHAAICLFAALVLMTFENFARTPETKERTDNIKASRRTYTEIQSPSIRWWWSKSKGENTISATKHNTTAPERCELLWRTFQWKYLWTHVSYGQISESPDTLRNIVKSN